MEKFTITITPTDLSTFTDSRTAVSAIIARTLGIESHVVILYTNRHTRLVCTNIGTAAHADYLLPDRLARLISQARNGKRITEPRTFTLRRSE